MSGKLGISIPILNQDCDRIAELAALADQAGFDSAWDYEFYRNPFVMHALSARATTRIGLGTAITAAAGRSPFEMANAAADIDEISGGRMLLGMGAGGAGFAEFLHGTKLDRPVARMREYIDVLRLAWKYLGDGAPVEYGGEFQRFASPPVNPWGLRPLARPRVPVYLAALQPAMLRLAGRQADGALGFLLSPRYIRERWLPAIADGARLAGREPAEVETVALVLCCVSDERDKAMRLARINVGMYLCSEVGAVFAEFAGLKEERDAMFAALVQEGPGVLERAVSDALVREFAIAGTPAEAQEQLQVYQWLLSHVILHTPYVPPISGEESEWAFRNTVRHFRR
jgi:alkanesulfonate monooxygenase SsuD/methylene tetrahydromethanopterin reductase-like flavin-dependent oxidoreductase (luciferase family)